MAISSFCSLNLPPPPVPSQITVHRTTQLPWRGRCLVGLMCCAIVGAEPGGLRAAEDGVAAAMEMEVAAPRISVRWSDRRACLPWRINSLETIVPENLPRPSGRRRWEFTSVPKEAPPIVKATAGSPEGGSCFTL